MSNDQLSIELEKREVLGKRVKQLRSSGKIPAVIHNHGKESIIVQGDKTALIKIYNAAGKHHPVEVKVGDKNYTTLIKSVEFENKNQDINHLVFNAVNINQKVEAEVPVHPKYNDENTASPAERAGLMVLNNLESVTIETTPSNIPDVLYYDAEKLVEIGDHIKASDLILPEGVELKTSPDSQLASVFEPSAVAAANDAVGGEAEEEVEVESDEKAEAESAKTSQEE